MKILGALQVPLRGACLVSGQDARNIPFHKLRRLVGVVFQDPESQIVGATVEDDVAFAPENQGLPPEEIRARVDDALERVGLLDKRAALVSCLSGGEKQRMAIAGALAMRVSCLILDEPTAMLDPEGRLGVTAALRAAWRAGMTLLQVTHRLEGLEDSDRVLVLEGGRLTWQGVAREFWPLAEEMGFELPPLVRLAGKLAKEGVRAAPTVEGLTSAIGARLAGRKEPLPQAEPSPSKDMPSLIEVRDLSFHFDEPPRLLALDGVMAQVPKGGWLSILGRTGSGKSTLVQHLNGLYKIQSGAICMEGRPLPQGGKELLALRRRVGLVFQSPEDQLFCPTVREELAFAPANAGLSGEDLERAVGWALDCVGLERDFLSRCPLALSGGERRLVAIASVLASEPECLVLDEPLAGLDMLYRQRLLRLLSRLRDEGRSVVTISHDLDAALRFSDLVLILDEGRNAAQGTPQAVLPALMGILSPDVWPGGLQVSARLRESFPSLPLTWDVDALASLGAAPAA